MTEQAYYDIFMFYGKKTYIAFQAFDHKNYWQIILS